MKNLIITYSFLLFWTDGPGDWKHSAQLMKVTSSVSTYMWQFHDEGGSSVVTSIHSYMVLAS